MKKFTTCGNNSQCDKIGPCSLEYSWDCNSIELEPSGVSLYFIYVLLLTALNILFFKYAKPVCTVVYTQVSIFFGASILDSQSEKEMRRKFYFKKIANKINANSKRTVHPAETPKSKQDSLPRHSGKKKPILTPQTGTKPSDKPEPEKPKKDFFWDFFKITHEVGALLKKFFKHFCEFASTLVKEFSIPDIDWEALSGYKDVLENNVFAIMDSEVLLHINTILNMLVALGWIHKIEFSYKDIPIFQTQPLHKRVTLSELTGAVWKLLKRLGVAIMRFVETGDITVFWDDVPKSHFEDMYSRIVSEWPLIDLGRTASLEFVQFDRELDNCINHCLQELKSCKDGERVYYSNRLLALRKIAIGRCKQKKGTLREAPFCILFAGGSSVGKTCIASAVGRYIAGVGGYDNHPDNCFSMNEQDKFMSGIATYHTVVRLDDMAQVRAEKATDCPLEKMVLLNNNQPMPATVPEAEKKGHVMLDPRVVTGTTNAPWLDAAKWVNAVEAIYRRFNVHVEQTVRPEYREEDTDRLDSSKIRHMAGEMFPDYGLYRPYKIVPQKNNSSTKMDKKVSVVYVRKYYFAEDKYLSIKELLKFLCEMALEHFKTQRAFVQGQRAHDELILCPECNMPDSLCDCEKLDSQLGFPGYNLVKSWYLALEERLCSQIDAYLRELFYSPAGFVLVGFSYREAISKVMQEYAINLAIIVFFVVFNEINGIRHGALILVGILMVYGVLLYRRVTQLREEMVAQWTTCPRPSVWFGNLSWETKKKILFAFGGLWMWRLLRNAATTYFNTLNTNQSGDVAVENEGFVINEKACNKDENPWWGDVGRLIREKRNKFFVQRGESAATTSQDDIIRLIAKRQCLVEKEDGEFCNIFPMQSNLWVLPTHFVPKKGMKATVRHPSRQHASVILDPDSIVHITGDLSLWYLPELGDQKDMTSYLPLESCPSDKDLECQMVYNSEGTVKISDKFVATFGRVLTTRGGFFKGCNYNFPIQTYNGLCMGTLVGLGKKKQHIVGFHLAGNGRKGGSGVLTEPDFAAAKSLLEARPSILTSHSATPFNTQIQDVNVGPLKSPHALCVTNSLPEGSKINIIGAHNQPGSSPSSKVVTSLISNPVTRIMKIAKIHGKPNDMTGRRHKEVDITGKVDTVYEINQKRLDRAYVDYSVTVLTGLKVTELGQVRIISNDANLSGLDGVLGVNAINFASSRGFPHKGPKTTIVSNSDRVVSGISFPRDAPDELWEEVRLLEDRLSNGERINSVFKASLKDEPTKYTKDKVRVFAACNFATIILVRKYYLSLAALVQRNQKVFECAVGVVQQSPEWTDMFEHIGKFGWSRAIAGDYGKFDARMSPRFMFAAFKLLIQIAEKSGNYSDRDLVIMKGIATEITYPTYDYFGTLVQFFGSNPSGHPLTVIINSLVNSLYMRYAYYTISTEARWWKTPCFANVVALMTYGDDNIMTVRRGYSEFNHTRIAEVFSQMGIKYTMADKEAKSVPYVHLSEASFLKHYAVWDEDLQLYRCPCEEESIAKMLHAHIKSDVLSKEQSAVEAVNNVALKYFEFGPQVYETRRQELMEVLRESNLLGYASDIPSYQDRMDWYKEKFELV